MPPGGGARGAWSIPNLKRAHEGVGRVSPPWALATLARALRPCQVRFTPPLEGGGLEPVPGISYPYWIWILSSGMICIPQGSKDGVMPQELTASSAVLMCENAKANSR